MVCIWLDSVCDVLNVEFVVVQVWKFVDWYVLLFYGGYKEVYNVQLVLFDIVQFEMLIDVKDMIIIFYWLLGVKDYWLVLRVYYCGLLIFLLVCVLFLENMGFYVINEWIYRVMLVDVLLFYLYEMILEVCIGEILDFIDKC